MSTRVLLETYLNVHSRARARDYSSTQTKSHVDPCRDGRDYPVTKMQTDRRHFSFIYLIIVDDECSIRVYQVHNKYREYSIRVITIMVSVLLEYIDIYRPNTSYYAGIMLDDFIEIFGFLWDFNLWISMDFRISMGSMGLFPLLK